MHAYADGWRRRLFSAVFPPLPPASCVLGWSLSLVLGGGPVALLGFVGRKSHAPALRPWRSAFTPRSSRAGAPRFRTHTAHARLCCLLRVARRCCSHPHARTASTPPCGSGCRPVLLACLWSFVLWCGHGVGSVESIFVQDRRNLTCAQQRDGPSLWNHPERLEPTSLKLTSQIYESLTNLTQQRPCRIYSGTILEGFAL